MFYVGTAVTTAEKPGDVWFVGAFVETDNNRVILESATLPGLSTSAPLDTLRRYF